VSDGLIDGNVLGADDRSALGAPIGTVDGVSDGLVLCATDGLLDG